MTHAGRVLQSPHRRCRRRRGRRLPRRLVQLYVGLALYGVVDGAAGALDARRHAVGRAAPGAGPPPRLVARHGLDRRRRARAAAWIPLRQRPGVGTVSNVVVIGVAVDATLAVAAGAVGPGRCGSASSRPGSLLNAVATAAYIGVHLGPGPARRPDDRPGRAAPAARCGWCAPSIEVAVVADRLAARRHARARHRASTRWPSARWCSCCCRGSRWPTAAGPREQARRR